MYLHQPGCVNALMWNANIHDIKTAPWGKMNEKKTSQQLSKQDVELRCLMAGCDGRVQFTVLERDKGTKDKNEEWYTAKWHTDAVEAEARKKKEEEEAKQRAIEVHNLSSVRILHLCCILAGNKSWAWCPAWCLSIIRHMHKRAKPEPQAASWMLAAQV